MARIQYRVNNFNQEKAKAYSLVAMVKTSILNDTTIYNIDEQGATNPNFMGAGIAKYKTSNGKFEFWCNGDAYLFTTSGVISDSSLDFKLMMAEVIESVNPSGNAATGTNTGNTQKDEHGNIIDGGISYGNRTIIIDSQNARDQFATEILNSIIQKLDTDPSSLSSSARSHYCQVAYDWAANMMTAAANARGTFTDETETSASAKQEAIGSLENNTDKLLNNLIVALERTDEKTVVEGVEVYSKKVSLPDIQGLLEKMDAANSILTGLRDNLTNAMSNMQGILTQQLGTYNQMVTQLSLIVASIQGFTQNIDNRMASIDQNVSAARTDIGDVQNGVNSIQNEATVMNATMGTINTNLNTVKTDVKVIKQNTDPS